MPQEKVQTFDFSSPELYNSVYVPLFKNRARFLHLVGSAGSGKSMFACQKEVALSFSSGRRNRKTLIVRKYFNTLANSVYAQLKSIIFDWKLQDYFEINKTPLVITNKITNVSFVFVGLDDVEKVKSIQGVDRIFIEEATELFTLSELDQLSLRLRGFNEVQITLAYNPVNAHHWLNTEIHLKLPPDHFIFRTTYKDNRFLDQNYKDFLESLQYSNPNYYKVYGLGEWGQNSEGLIFPDFTVVPSMPMICAYGLDFGFNDPTALVSLSVADTHESVRKTLFINELLYETKLTSDALVSRLKSLNIREDLPIVADNARPEIIQTLRSASFSVVESEKGAGSVRAGINELKRYDLRILAGSRNLIKELENYSWRNKNGVWMDEPEPGGADHLIDAARYACFNLLRRGTPVPAFAGHRHAASFRML